MVVVDNNQENETNNQQQQGQDNFMSQPVNVSGSSASSSGSSNTPSQSPQQSNAAPSQQYNASAPTTSGNFNNIKNYINANQGYNQQQGGLAGQVNNSLGQQGTQIQQGIQNTQNDFNQQANKSLYNYNSGLVNQATSDPYNFANNQDNYTQLVQQRDATYTGPTSLQNTGQLQNSLQNYQTLAGQTQNENGRFNLLNQLYNNGNYTQGQQTLDNLFLQAPDQQAQMQQAMVNANNVGQQFNDAQSQAQGTAANYKNIDQLTSDQTRGALNSAVTGLNTNITAEQAAAVQAQKDAYSQLIANLGTGNLSADQATKLGLSSGDSLYNTFSDPKADYGKYFTQSVAPTVQQAATTNDYNNLSGLSKLLGNYANSDASQVFSQFGNPALAGQYDKDNPYSVNTNSLKNDLAAKNAAYKAATTYTGQSPGDPLRAGDDAWHTLNPDNGTSPTLLQQLTDQANNYKGTAYNQVDPNVLKQIFTSAGMTQNANDLSQNRANAGNGNSQPLPNDQQAAYAQALKQLSQNELLNDYYRGQQTNTTGNVADVQDPKVQAYQDALAKQAQYDSYMDQMKKQYGFNNKVNINS